MIIDYFIEYRADFFAEVTIDANRSIRHGVLKSLLISVHQDTVDRADLHAC